jgi:nitrite reductase/ring-hydroxylating ferredoxin subunit
MSRPGARGFTVGRGDWPLRGFVVRENDNVWGYVNRCPHAGRQLNFMPDRFLLPDGSLIQCIAHGALFEKDTGECVAGPCVGEQLRRIPVQVVAGAVQLSEDLDLSRLARGPW